ncbi:hypothetical protein CEP51_007150 [Fusarium floridanum]|uniref:Uncharacterized protein n=1 Tax=Fusarium floridanum TaxID=1325733 RepID=A0A428RQ78_9HYPO|nr:hypothetical protein CEP51_007150 [Fusarium floridanum]
MKSPSTFMLLALLTSTLAGAATEPSTCITTKTLPAITIYSCPGDSEPTKTVFPPAQSPNSASQPGALGSSGVPGVPGAPGSPGATGQVDGPEEPNATKHVGNVHEPQQSNAPESPGSGSNSGSESGSNPNSGSSQHVDASEPSASEPGVVPVSPETPSVVAVAGAPIVHLDLLLLSAVGIASVAMVWF